MPHYRNGIGDDGLGPKTVEGFEKRYDDILLEAQKEYEDEPPGDYYREEYNLYLRLVKYKETERLARIYKRKQKQAMEMSDVIAGMPVSNVTGRSVNF